MAKLEIKPREITGKQVKNIRTVGEAPAVLYGPNMKSTMATINAKEFSKVFEEAGYSALIDINFNSKKQKVLVKEVQKNPVNDQILHVSLYVVDQETEITTEVPVEFVGLAIAQDQGLGFVVHALDAVTVRCLPANLPAKFEIDVSHLANIGETITIADMKMPEGVELDSNMDPTTAIAYVAGDQKEIVEEEPVVEGEEGAEGATAEGAEGAEGTEGEAAAEGAKEE